jgi:PKHD-type hydroxylase
MEIKPIIPVPTHINQTNYYWYKEGLDLIDIQKVEDLADTHPYIKGTIIGNDEIMESVRKSKIKWLYPNDDSQWLYDKIINMVVEANKTMWNFNLYSVIDSIQYTVYSEGGGHYDWHMDIGPGSISHRKVSVTIQLSDPSEYEGGDLELWYGGGGVIQIPKNKGLTVIFPSFSMHRVTPITKGTRKSLVLWLGGEHYK